MRSWGKFKKEKECFLALDIGTEAVKALVCKKEGQKYFITAATSQYLEKEKIISQVKEELANDAGAVLDKLFLNLPADILRGRIHFEGFLRKGFQKIIDKKEKELIYQTILGEAQKEISRNFAEDYGILPQDIQFIGLEVLDIKIDGYEVPTIEGYAGKNIDFRIFASFIPKYHYQNFGCLIENLGFKDYKIFHPLRNLDKVSRFAQGVFLDVGGKTTQICLIRNGKIEMIDEFEGGGYDFSLALSQQFGLREPEARFLKERYSRGELTEEVRGRIGEILTTTAEGWFSGLKSKLKTIKGLPPSTFFLFGGGSLLPEIEKVISDEGVETEFIFPKDFKNIVDNTCIVNNPQYINAILLCHHG